MMILATMVTSGTGYFQLSSEQGDGGNVDHAGRETLRIGSPDHQGQVLQKIAHTDGGDQYGQTGRLPQGSVGQTLDHHAHHRAGEHGNHKGNQRRHIPVLERAERNIGAHHNDVAVRKVQHLGYAVNHGVSKGNDGIDTAKTDAVHQIIQKDHERVLPVF